MRCADCGGHNVLTNSNAAEWAWPHRCFDCHPITDEELARGDQFPAWLMQRRRRQLNLRGLDALGKPLSRWGHIKVALGMAA